MPDADYRAGRNCAEQLKQSESYAGEYDGDVYLYETMKHPRSSRRVPARQVLNNQARQLGIELSDVEQALEGFLDTLRQDEPEHQVYVEPEEPPQLLFHKDDPGVIWVDFGA